MSYVDLGNSDNMALIVTVLPNCIQNDLSSNCQIEFQGHRSKAARQKYTFQIFKHYQDKLQIEYLNLTIYKLFKCERYFSKLFLLLILVNM